MRGYLGLFLFQNTMYSFKIKTKTYLRQNIMAADSSWTLSSIPTRDVRANVSLGILVLMCFYYLHFKFAYHINKVSLQQKLTTGMHLLTVAPLVFYALGLKGPPGASSNWIVCLSFHLSVCLPVCNSVLLTNNVQYLNFGWLYSHQTWTVSSSMGSSHFTDITCPCGWGGVKM